MADDIKIIWNQDFFEGDISYSNGDLIREDGLETAVLMSLFTDRRASIEDFLPDPSNLDLHGWWGDQITDSPGDEIGSKLWLLSRSKTDQETLIRAESYITEALEWLIEDEVAVSTDVEVFRIERPDKSATLGSLIKILQSDGTTVALTFSDLWKAQVEFSN